MLAAKPNFYISVKVNVLLDSLLVPMGMFLDSVVLTICPKKWPRVYSAT